jgi:hypothetical protein
MVVINASDILGLALFVMAGLYALWIAVKAGR